MAEVKQFRDVFNPVVINRFAERLNKAWSGFDAEQFTAYINPKLSALSYSERIGLIKDALRIFLPHEFSEAIRILLDAQHPPYTSEVLDRTYERFIAVPQTYYVSEFGIDHFDLSMQALYEMTKRFSSEFGVRAFLIAQPEATLDFLKKCTNDPDPHVRRWASEGSRPYLPWGKKLHFVEKKPTSTFEILDALKTDESEYVRRSVANHLNDLSKKHPDYVVDTLSRWRKTVSGKDFERMCNHALRSLIKAGHTGALAFKGFRADIEVSVSNLVCTPIVEMPGLLDFSFAISSQSEKTEKIVIDYIIHFQKANGKTAPKVFKLKTTTIASEEVIDIKKSHKIKPITTRVYYAGTHQVEVQINGKVWAGNDFELRL